MKLKRNKDNLLCNSTKTFKFNTESYEGYSYNHCIGKIWDTDDGRVLIVNEYARSNTTAKHISEYKYQIQGTSIDKIYLNAIESTDKIAVFESALNWCDVEIKGYTEAVSNPRKHKKRDEYKERLSELKDLRKRISKIYYSLKD